MVQNLLLLLMFLIVAVPHASSQKLRIEARSYMDGNPIALEITDGMISGLEKISELSDSDNDLFLAPGLIDNQVNGFAGISFAFGGGELSPSDVELATHKLWENGVTSYLPTLTTNSFDVLFSNLRLISEAINSSDLLGSIPGFHLEGPYINPEDGYRGAHPKEFVRLPDWTEFLKLYKASGNKILQITLAPEMEGAQEFIKKANDLGITVALGHHNANAEQVNMAVANSAKISTHFGNGCANMINRHQNPLWPQLANNSLMLSIICDGFHLLPEEIITFIKVKGVDGIILTSDVTSYAGLPPGEYVSSTGDSIELTLAGKLQFPAQEVLYGSASPLSKGIGHVMKTTACSLADAIQMASTNPAKLYGFNDRGTLDIGKRADLILFRMNNSVMKVMKTYVRGQLVYNSSLNFDEK